MRRTGAPVSHGDPSTDLWPTPADLADAPELAILAALDDILDLTVCTLVSLYPELADPERPYWLRESSRTAHAADLLVARTSGLKQALTEYRKAVVLRREADGPHDLDVPF